MSPGLAELPHDEDVISSPGTREGRGYLRGRACSSEVRRAQAGPVVAQVRVRPPVVDAVFGRYSDSVAKSASRERSPRTSVTWPLWCHRLKRSTA